MLTSPALPATVHRFTRDDVHRMHEAGILAADERIELIDGVLIRMSPQDPRHYRAIVVLHRLLTDLLTEATVEAYHVRMQGPLALGTHSEPEPDLAITRGTPDDYAHVHPTPPDVLVAIEVSNTTLAYDRSTKQRLYATHRVPAYWIVNLQTDTVEMYTSPTGTGDAAQYGVHTSVEAGGTITLPPPLTDRTIPIRSVFMAS